MGLNFTRRPPRADLDDPNLFITEALGDEYGDNGETMHMADGHLSMEFVDKTLDRADVKLRGLFGYGNS